MNATGLSRRGFLSTAGGLFIFIRAEAEPPYQEPARLPQRGNYPADFNAYLRIGADGRVACFTGKVELGQGPATALAQILADELDVAFDSIDMVLGDTDQCPYDMGTFGSMCIPMFGPALRAAGAEARAVLLQLASERLQAPVSRLQVRAGIVTDPAQDKRVTYAQLVEGKRIERHLEKVPVKAPGALAVVGKSPIRKDAAAKVTGKTKYAADITFPGMLHARLVRPPAHGAKLKSVDTAPAEKAGARVVKDGDMVAVLHERRDIADRALGLLKPEFELPPAGPDDKTIFDHLLKTAPQPRVVAQAGSLAEGEKLASATLEHTYLNSYVAHAAMEPHSATANIENGKATVWASTQAPFSVRQAVAGALGVQPQNVRVIATWVGGGFGGKTAGPQAVEAARLAKITGKPVQVVWDRAEEFFYDPFRPASVVKVRSGLDAAGKIAFWELAAVGPGDREAKTFYDVPHQRTTSAGGWQGGNPPGMHPFDVGPWRAPSVNTLSFARESHMDVLAAKAGVDPCEFRLKHVSDPRMRRVLEAVAAKFGWQPAKAPSGRGVGVACGMYAGTYVATMAEVAVNKTTGQVRVKRVVSAMDQGLTVNADGQRQQMEGSITMGLGYTLTEEVRFKNGAVLDRNFDTYELPRFSWLPKIETILIENPAMPATAGGEPPIITVGALVANAIFDATGARLLQLPMTPARVKAALAGARS
jgi:nicotinate dehydrogenase subunit B